MPVSSIDFNGLDTLVHGPVRLGVLTVLQVEGPLDFTTLSKRFEIADGAMGAHLRKLEDSGYVSCKREFVGRRPRTTYSLTTVGRRALKQYMETMQQIIDLASGDPRH
jgi:DNA-binding PadR family transcriptional regulator